MFTRKSVGRCRAILTARSIVLCNEYIEEANIPTVKFDHAQGAYIVAKHVLDQGYRNLIFAVVTKPKSLASAKNGLLRAITEKSRQVEAIDFLENAFSWEDGKRIFHEVLKDKKSYRDFGRRR